MQDAVNLWRNGLVERAGLSWDTLEINSIAQTGQVAALRELGTSTRLSDDMKKSIAARINSGKEAMAIVNLGDRTGGGVGVDSRRLVFMDPTTARVTASAELFRGRL
jgi:hypothetical protein